MTAFVFKPKRNGRASRTYVGRYRLPGDLKATTVALGVSGKQVAQEKLRRIVREAEQERLGLLAPKGQRQAASEAIKVHVEAFVAHRRASRRNEKYVDELRRKLLRLINECSWRTAADLTAESFYEWRARETKSAKTLNEYRNAVSAFARWLEPRIGRNPLGAVEKVQGGDAKRLRRSFTEDELQRLIVAGGERGVAYLIPARTGIRRGELGQIEWRDVNLEAKQPFILVRASVSKNHRQAMQPLPPDAWKALKALKASCAAKPYERVFARLIPRMELFRKDLKAAGILYQDARGEYADFHALRKTFGTMLTLAGVGERTDYGIDAA